MLFWLNRSACLIWFCRVILFKPRVCMLILVFTFDVGKYYNEKKNGFRSVGCWENNGFSWVFFFPSCLVTEKINVRQTFFYWATEWALKYHGPMGPMEPSKLDWGGSGPQEKICLVNGSGPSRGSWHAGQVWVWKNLTWTQPVAIPKIMNINDFFFFLKIIFIRIWPIKA